MSYTEFALEVSRDALQNANAAVRLGNAALKRGSFGDARAYARVAGAHVDVSERAISHVDGFVEPKVGEHRASAAEIIARAVELESTASYVIDKEGPSHRPVAAAGDTAESAPVDEPVAPAGRVKVSGLTWANIQAVTEFRDEFETLDEITKTTVVFRGEPAAVLDDLRRVKNHVHVTRGGRSTENRSLVAVVNKVDHFVNGGRGAKHVKVIA